MLAIKVSRDLGEEGVVLWSGETASFVVERLAGVRTERQLDSVRGVSVSGNAEQDHRHTD